MIFYYEYSQSIVKEFSSLTEYTPMTTHRTVFQSFFGESRFGDHKIGKQGVAKVPLPPLLDDKADALP